jgi:hypothetical protein
MDLKQGFEHFLNSENFKQLSKLSSKYRVNKKRYYDGELAEDKMKSILREHGYTVNDKTTVKPPVKEPKKR